MRSMARFCVAVLAALALTPALASDLNDKDRAALEAIDQRVAPLRGAQDKTPAPLVQRMAESRVPAVSIAYIEGGRVKWTRAYGVAVSGTTTPATPDTRFQAASMSKAVAAAGALRLVDRGRLTLDEDVATRLRSWRLPAEPHPGPISLRQLLSHTAGLNVSGYPGYARDKPVPGVVRLLDGKSPANTAAMRRFAAPGAQMAYSGGGYTVAQLLMSDVTRTGFGPWMARTLLRPAGMARATFDQRPPRDAAHGHGVDGTPLAGGSHIYPELAAAGLWSTPSDYGRFLIALQNSWQGTPGALLKPATMREMATPVLADYALGVTVTRVGGRVAISHGGGNAGYRCRFVAFLDGAREGVVIMTNSDNGAALVAAIHFTLARAYGWPDVSGPPIARAPDV